MTMTQTRREFLTTQPKNDPGWVVHTLPCTHFIQLEMPDELTAILLKAIP